MQRQQQRWGVWEKLQERPGAKTINVFRACLGAQLTICAQKWRNFVLFSTVSFRFVSSRVCVFLYSLGPWMDKIRNGEIRRRVNMKPAEQPANKNKIRWWSHVKRMAPTAPQSKPIMINPVGKRPRGRPRNRWEDDVPKWYNDMGIPMTDVNNWVKERCPIVYPLDADGRSIRLK